MSRMSGVVASGYPHPITHRDNQRMKTFFGEEGCAYNGFAEIEQYHSEYLNSTLFDGNYLCL